MTESSKSTAPSEKRDAASEDLFEGPPRTVERIDRVLSLIRREWLARPDERFGQLVSNLAEEFGFGPYLRLLEDDILMEMLENGGSSSPNQNNERG